MIGLDMSMSFEVACNTLKLMIERGNEYRRLEAVFGRGICFVLGTALSETQYVPI